MGHNKIEITTTYRIKEEKINKKKQDEDNTLRSLNFHDERKFDWKQIIKLIKEMPWRKICNSGKAIEVIEYLLEKLYEICIEIVPKRNKEGKKKNIPKEIKNLLNRIKMLKRDKHRAYSKEKKKQIDNKICETEKQLVQTRQKTKLKKERQAIECMKENPKMLYSIRNKQKNRRNDIEVTEEEIIKASDDLEENSAAGPDGVPAILLKKVKEALALPLSLMLRESIDEGKIPDILKLAYVTPIHKGGSRQKPEQYRPVSLTSHVMKVFERVIKKKIIEHLEKTEKINDGQHGFVPGRSTQTQLLCHYNDIYEALTEGKRMDTVFLDFAKAFDKIDHNILLEKVKKTWYRR